VETELLKAKRHDELILDAVREGIYGIDTADLITFTNPAAAQMLGWSAREMIGRPQHETFHHLHKDGTLYTPVRMSNLFCLP